MNPDLDAGGLFEAMLPSLLIGLLFYIYLAVTLGIMARKTGTPGGWMAWVPIANLVLMCRIGGKSGGLVLLMLIPFVNLIVFAYVWAAMARARGKSGGVGVLIVVPLVNLFIPAYLAMGPPRARMAAGTAGAPQPPPDPTRPDARRAGDRPATAGAPVTHRCLHCDTPNQPGDAFCGECGRPLPPVDTPPPPQKEPPPPVHQKKSSGAGGVIAVVAAVLLLGGGWYLYANVFGYRAPARQAPALPERLAGALTEFPVDTDPAQPAQPASVITQRIQSGDDLNVPDDWLPPGVRTTLPSQAEAIISTQYRTPTDTTPISVHVVDTRAGRQTASTLSRTVERATGGRRSGVQVESPTGQVYQGVRIQSLELIIYILANLASDRVIIIYAPAPSTFEVATRLAGNVGNGEGLNDYPEVRNALWALPTSPAPGLTLLETNTYTRADFDQYLGELEAFADDTNSPEVQQLVEQVRSLFPNRITTANYEDTAFQEWNVGIGEFGSAWKAWTTWLLLRGVLTFGDQAVQLLPSGEGVYADMEEGRVVFARKGPHIVVLTGPVGTPLNRLMNLWGTFQL